MLIYPPSEPFFIHPTKMFYGLTPPLGLLYLASNLQHEGDKVTILDFSAEPYDNQKITSVLNDADAVGLTLLSPALEQGKQIITDIKHHHPDLPVIIGGPHCTLLPEKSLEETQADISVQGDAETIITDLRHAIEQKKPFSEITGVTTRTTHGFTHGPPPQTRDNLNTELFPARHLTKHYIYGRSYNPRLKAGEFTSIITSRGCPYTCRFCSRSILHQHQHQMRSTENILRELREIKEQGYRHVAIVDDCFPTHLKQAHQLFDAINTEHLDLTFSVTGTRVDLADAPLYKKMKKAGVAHMQFGLESGNQDVLDYYEKHVTVNAIRKAVHLSHTTGFFTMGSFIFGAPFETAEHFKTTQTFACSLPLDSVSFLPLRYMVGSALWTQAVHDGHIKADDYCVPADKNKGLGRYTTEELLRFCHHAQQAFYTRPSFALSLLKHSLQNNDMTFMQSYLSMFFSSVKELV